MLDLRSAVNDWQQKHPDQMPIGQAVAVALLAIDDWYLEDRVTPEVRKARQTLVRLMKDLEVTKHDEK